MATARSMVTPPLAAALLLAACSAGGATTPLPNGEEGGNGWRFAGLPWNTSSGGVITAPGKGPSCGGKTTASCTHPTNNSDANVAFHATAAYEEFEVSFDFTISVPFTAQRGPGLRRAQRARIQGGFDGRERHRGEG